MLGKKFRDVITGYEGICIGRAEYLTGCETLLLVPRVKADGTRVEGEWFDADRLEVLDDSVIQLPGQQNRRVDDDLRWRAVGGDREAPKR